MIIKTPEISWHAKEAIYSVDIQAVQEGQPHRLATGGIDSNVRIWELKPSSKTGIAFLSNLSRHERAVNVVRFSKCGKTLASGGDDGTVVLWKLNDRNDVPNIFEDDSDIGKNVETWNAHKVLRGHIEDVNDLSWSDDGSYLMSGSIDHTAIIWDVTKASKVVIMTEAKHFIHGVAYDPMGDFAVTLSGDRSMRVYSLKSNRVIHNVCKMIYPSNTENNETKTEECEVSSTKTQRMFHDETVVRRRLTFTPDGSLLIVPSGTLNRKQASQVEQINTAYVFSRTCFSKPAVVLPGFKQPVAVIRCCPAKFLLRTFTNNSSNSALSIPYRIIFAIASTDTVILYDSQTFEPFSVISNVHYAAITDLAWSSDAHQLVISSRDGFCTIVTFDENELGEMYRECVSSPETVQDAMDIDNTNTDNAVTSNGTEIDENGAAKNHVIESHDGVSNVTKEKDSTIQDGQEMDTSTTAIIQDTALPSSQEKSAPRRIQLTTISTPPHTPIANKPRRVQLTPVSLCPEDVSKENTPQKVSNVCNGPTSANNGVSPKSATEGEEKKKTPRRIQLISLDK